MKSFAFINLNLNLIKFSFKFSSKIQDNFSISGKLIQIIRIISIERLEKLDNIVEVFRCLTYSSFPKQFLFIIGRSVDSDYPLFNYPSRMQWSSSSVFRIFVTFRRNVFYFITFPLNIFLTFYNYL